MHVSKDFDGIDLYILLPLPNPSKIVPGLTIVDGLLNFGVASVWSYYGANSIFILHSSVISRAFILVVILIIVFLVVIFTVRHFLA